MTPNNSDSNELIFTGIFLAVIALINKILNAFFRNRLKGSSNAFAAGIKVYDLMNSIIQETPSARVIIFKAVNGGKKIKLGSHLNINSVQGVSELPFIADEWKRYRGLIVDEEYNRMLLEVSTQKVKKLVIDNNNTSTSLLHNIYKSVGVKYAEIHHIYDNKTEYYFMSVSTDQDISFDDNPTWRSSVDLNVRKIGKIYSKNLN